MNIEDLTPKELAELFSAIVQYDEDSKAEEEFNAQSADDEASKPEQPEYRDDDMEDRDRDGYMLPSHPEYNPVSHVLTLIDSIMVNTLSTDGTISGESVDTLLKLNAVRTSYLVTL